MSSHWHFLSNPLRCLSLVMSSGCVSVQTLDTIYDLEPGETPVLLLLVTTVCDLLCCHC